MLDLALQKGVCSVSGVVRLCFFQPLCTSTYSPKDSGPTYKTGSFFLAVDKHLCISSQDDGVEGKQRLQSLMGEFHLVFMQVSAI